MHQKIQSTKDHRSRS